MNTKKLYILFKLSIMISRTMLRIELCDGNLNKNSAIFVEVATCCK